VKFFNQDSKRKSSKPKLEVNIKLKKEWTNWNIRSSPSVLAVC